MSKLVAAVAVIAVALMLIGAPEAAGFTTGGLGTASCGAWTSARRDREARGYEQWVLGFLSGIGYAADEEEDPLQGTDSDGVWAWMDNYCQANALAKIVDAGKAFDQARPH